MCFHQTNLSQPAHISAPPTITCRQVPSACHSFAVLSSLPDATRPSKVQAAQ